MLSKLRHGKLTMILQAFIEQFSSNVDSYKCWLLQARDLSRQANAFRLSFQCSKEKGHYIPGLI